MGRIRKLRDFRRRVGFRRAAVVAVRFREGPFTILFADFAHRALLTIGLVLWELTTEISIVTCRLKKTSSQWAPFGQVTTR